MNGLYPIIRRVRRPLVPLVEPEKVKAEALAPKAFGAGGADAKLTPAGQEVPVVSAEVSTQEIEHAIPAKNKGKGGRG